MAGNNEIKNIFLSASIPLQEGDPQYIETADIIAIRDTVIALTIVVPPRYRLIWGGHPSTMPLIYHVMEKLNLNIQEHVTLYQSRFFEKYSPKDDNKFKNIVSTDTVDDRENSLLHMRSRTLGKSKFVVGTFIGGMEGVEEEYNMFIEEHPKASILLIVNTGAGAKKNI